MKQDIHTKINWLEYNQLKYILEYFGFGVDASESEEDLREALRVNIADGTINLCVLDW